MHFTPPVLPVLKFYSLLYTCSMPMPPIQLPMASCSRATGGHGRCPGSGVIDSYASSRRRFSDSSECGRSLISLITHHHLHRVAAMLPGDLCRHPEGWGPISHLRPFDFTPCFEDAVLFSIPLGLLIALSLLRSWHLSRLSALRRTQRINTWILWAKLVRRLACSFPYLVVPYFLTESLDPGYSWFHSINQPLQSRYCRCMSTVHIFLPAVCLGSRCFPRSPTAHLSESYSDPTIINHRLTILVGLLSRAPNLDSYRHHARGDSIHSCVAMEHWWARRRCVCS